MFQDELRQLLDDLNEAAGALSAAIIRPEEDRRQRVLRPAREIDDESEPAGEGSEEVADERIVPLGGGAFLLVRFAAAEDRAALEKRDAAIERAVRALRACARRWEMNRFPAMSRGEAIPAPVKVLERIESFLSALANTQHAANALVILRGELITSAEPLEDEHRERIPFTLKQLRAEIERRKGESSHAEITGEDVYAVSFWFDACLIVFFTGPYSTDFMRHRARRVTRELANLLPALDDPTLDPVQAAPVPE
jgi:hypothetical protein